MYSSDESSKIYKAAIAESVFVYSTCRLRHIIYALNNITDMHTVLQMMWDEPKYTVLYVFHGVASQIKTFRYVYGITLVATSETHIQNTAAQAYVHHGRSESGVDEFGVSY